jgi:ABC-type phosphate transport system auxiliary subunit
MASSDDQRFDKIEDVIARLSNVASDLSRMLAVHDQRLQQQEKMSDTIGAQLEKRKDEVDKKFDLVYETIKSGDESIKQEIKKIVDARDKQIDGANEKISRLEKWQWMVMGGSAVIGYLIHLGLNAAKILQ